MTNSLLHSVVKILSIATNRSEHTLQTQIRLLLESSLIRIYIFVIISVSFEHLTVQMYCKTNCSILTLLHSEQPKLYGVLAILSAVVVRTVAMFISGADFLQFLQDIRSAVTV